jgi:glycosyltransferase involved in cell wall biosynthesis
MKKKILYVDNRSQYFVAHRLPLAIAAHNRLAEVHVTALSRREPDLEIIASQGLKFHQLRSNANNESVTKPVIMALQLAQMIRELKPNIVHFFTLKAMCVGSIAIAFLLRQTVPTLMSFTGLGYTFSSGSLKAGLLRIPLGMVFPRLLNRTCRYFVFENYDDLSFCQKYFDLPREALYLGKCSGVDVGTYVSLPEKSGDPIVMVASRMLRDKGIFEFVDAARQLKLEGIQARFLLVGDTDPENPTGIPASQLMEWHYSGIVEWHGYCHEMINAFSQAHIVCLPSYREGTPKVLMEAAACGRPIVTTDVPGCREVVRHEENGLLVPPRDSRALATALHSLIRNPELRVSMGRKGRELAEKEFSLEKMINDTFKIYEKVFDS